LKWVFDKTRVHASEASSIDEDKPAKDDDWLKIGGISSIDEKDEGLLLLEEELTDEVLFKDANSD
jgi:hypothetical protein